MTTQSPSPDALLPTREQIIAELMKAIQRLLDSADSVANDFNTAEMDDHIIYVTHCLQQLRNTPAPSAEQPTTAREGCELIAQERRRQIEQEGWTPKHDDTHDEAELAKAAAHYVLFASKQKSQRERERGILGSGALGWPWDREWWKPSLGNSDTDRIRELVKAGALIAAEIDRLNRKTPT